MAHQVLAATARALAHCSTNGLSDATHSLSATYGYDSDGRLRSVTATQPSSFNASTYPTGLFTAGSSSPAYAPGGGLANGQFGIPANGSTGAFATARQYDPYGRVINQSSGSVYQFSIPSNGGYAPNGNISQQQDSITGNWNYGYDTLNRLINSSTSGGTYNGENGCWQYDAFGNRILESISTASQPCPAGTPTLGVTPGTNRLSSMSYDLAGNIVYDGQNQYFYDVEGRVCLVAVSGGGYSQMYQYVYDADGHRVATGTTTTGGCIAPTVTNGFSVSKQFLLDLGGYPTTELGASGPKHTNFQLPGGVTATYDFINGGLHFAVSDPLGTKRVQIAGTGALEEVCTSLPFGNDINNPRAASCSNSGAPDATEQHYTGKERDAESGLDYFGARYYANTVGRFTSPDDGSDQNPENPQSLNLYAYVRNNPINSVDSDRRSVQICTPGNGTIMCTTLTNDAYTHAAKGFNGSLNVPSLNQVGMNGDGSGQFNATNITDARGNTVGTATYVSNGSLDYYANRNGLNTLAAASATVGSVKGVASFYGVSALLGAGVAASPLFGAEAANLSILTEDLEGVLARAGSSVGNQSAKVASREVAEAIAKKFVGEGAEPMYANHAAEGGQQIGLKSADGLRQVRWTSANTKNYINLINTATGGNLHVGW